MEELINNLVYVRKLLSVMGNLNNEEAEIKSKLKPLKDVKLVNYKKTNSVKSQIKAVAIVFGAMIVAIPMLVLFVFSSFGFSEGFTAAITVLVIMLVVLVPLVAIIALSMYFGENMHNSDVDKKNKLGLERYNRAIEENKAIAAENEKVQQEIESLHERKTLISQEYVSSICTWFPKEYCYFEAVDFFIHELELGTANNLPEAIMNYREHVFRENVYSNLNKINDNQKVIINNQEIYIRKEEEMIRQQMIGNFIACATWLETRRISGISNRIANNSNRIANNSEITAGYAADIYRKIKEM